MLRIHAFWLLIAAGLTGCGASTSESSLESESELRPVSSSSPSAQRYVFGNATKGPLINSTVELFELDASGYPIGVAIASTQTDATGNWSLPVGRDDAVLVRISGGSYVDEADTNVDSRRFVELSGDQFLESILLPGEDAVAVTVFTQALLRKSRRETGQNNFVEVVGNNRQLFREAYGFDVLNVLPADPLAPSGTADAIAYAMSVGGVANAINALSIGSNSALPEYAHILSVVEDLVDCRLDGLGTGAQQVVNPALPGYQDLSLQQQVLRFRNNNFSVYEGFEPGVIDASRCDVLGGVADTTAPQVTQTANTPYFEAIAPEGVSLTKVQRDSLRDQFVATDDRGGELVWAVEIPQQLPIGTTPLTATVRDAWGNRTDAGWQIQVGDTTPPGFESLGPVTANAQGDFTMVELQRPEVSDRVSAQNEIVVTNDAPQGGFPVGSTQLTWLAQDAAGNTATFVQEVTINSIAPVTTPAPPVIQIGSTGVDFSQFFMDPDGTSLTYAIAGLPADSGFVLDPATGILGGTPSPADVAAQFIELTISATDGQNTVSLQTTINVIAPNTPPVFAVSQANLSLEEDFANQSVQIQPLDVPDAEVGQMVSYAVEFASQQALDSAPFEVVLDSDALIFTLVARPDAFGVASFDVVANDGQSENSEYIQTVTVSVLAVNDPPRLTGINDPVALTVGVPFELDLKTRVIDVDDEALVFSVDQLPSAISMSPQGQLAGMALPSDALSDEIAVQVNALDAQGESIDFAIRIQATNPDTDGDGLTDYEEGLSGFDAALTDSDGDGFGDSLESKIEISEPQTVVIFVGADGDDAQAGDSPGTALATLGEAGVRMAQLANDQAVVVLIEQDAVAVGGLELTGSNRTLMGSVDFNTLQASTGDVSWVASASSISGSGQDVVVVSDCQACSLRDILVTGGQGLSVINSDVTLDRVHLIGAASVSGGALYIDSSLVTASNMHFAANKAEQGGALYVDSGSQFTIFNSEFSGNNAAQSGGAVFVSNSSFVAHNVVFAANTAPSGAVVDAVSGNVVITNATVAYNQLKSLSEDRLFRCRDAFLNACLDSESVLMVDSIIAGNRNAGGDTVDIASVRSTGSGNLVEPGRAVGTLAGALMTIEPYGVGYVSPDPGVLNSGSQSAIEAGLDRYFSVIDSAFTDTGQVESGWHSARPLRSVDDYSVAAEFAEDQALFALRAVDITVMDSISQQALAGDHRITVTSLGVDPHAVVVSPGTVPGGAPGARPAVSLGDGRYRIWVSNSFNSGQDFLMVQLDGDVSGVQVAVFCNVLLCGSPSVTTAVAGSQFVDDERITPATALARPVPDGKPSLGVNAAIPVQD